MKGISYLTDGQNRRKSVVIDLKTLYENPDAIEDLLYTVVTEHRQSEPKKDWEKVKAERAARTRK